MNEYFSSEIWNLSAQDAVSGDKKENFYCKANTTVTAHTVLSISLTLTVNREENPKRKDRKC